LFNHHFESLRDERPSIQERVSERQNRYKSLDGSFSSLRQNSVSYMMDTRDKALHADGIDRCNWHISRRLMPGPSLLIQLKANVVVKSINNTIRSSQKRPPVQVVLHLITASLSVSLSCRSSLRMPSFYFVLVTRTCTQAHKPSKLQKARFSSPRPHSSSLS
jgi:hypothetical protein